MDIQRALDHLPPPDPTAPDRIWARFQETRRPRRSRAPWIGLVTLSAAAAAALLLVPRAEDPRTLPLDAETPSAVAWSEQVDLSYTGHGAATGLANDVVVHWESGALQAEVEPHSGTDLTVVTEEGVIHVVGTAFEVTRDRMGVTVEVQRGTVDVDCTFGFRGLLHAGEPARTCLPLRPALLLGRADALLDAGASAELVGTTLDLGVERAKQGSAVRGELLARRMQLHADAGRADAALEDAATYLAAGPGPRTVEVRRHAAWLALSARGCADALPHLEALSTDATGTDRVLHAECLASTDPARALELLDGARDLDGTWTDRADAARAALGEDPLIARSTLLLLLASGCTQTVFFPPDLWTEGTWWDSGNQATTVPDELAPVLLQFVTASCDRAATAWTFTAETDGWSGGATLGIYGSPVTSGWSEEHDMTVVDSDPAGGWDLLAVGPLTTPTPAEEWVPNENTAFDCEDPSLSFVIKLYDHLGALSDCAVWGSDPGALDAMLQSEFAVRDIGGCVYFTP